MTKLFPSILPDGETYTAAELDEWDWKQELRIIAAELDTDDISGRSTRLEVVHFLAGRYNKSTLDVMRAEAKTNNPDFSQIAKPEPDE